MSKESIDIRIDKLYWVNRIALIHLDKLHKFNQLHILDTNPDGKFTEYDVGKRMFPKPIFVERKKLETHIKKDYVVLELDTIEELYDRQHIQNIKSVQSFFLD